MASLPPIQQYPPQPSHPYYPPQPSHPYYPPDNPIAGPAKAFGIIYACFAGLAIIGALTMLAISGFAIHPPGQSPDNGYPAASMGIFFGVITVFILIVAALEAVTAYGLLARKPWGRTLLIVTSILSLISIPFGTILGGFALYFFMRGGAEQDYARLTLGQP